MSWTEYAEKAGQSAVSWIVAAILGGMLWLVRRVFTNQKQLELLRQELDTRDELRKRDREDLLEVKSDLKEIRSDIRAISLK